MSKIEPLDTWDIKGNGRISLDDLDHTVPTIIHKLNEVIEVINSLEE